MAIEYDNNVWRLHTGEPDNYNLILPKDLEWSDEFSWHPISHDIKNTLTGGIIIHEYKKTVGRPITLVGQENMAWVKRSDIKILHEMSQETQLRMTLDFVKATYNQELDTWFLGVVDLSFTVMFNHAEMPLEVESVKRFDNFENNSWFKINAIRFIEVNESAINPCV